MRIFPGIKSEGKQLHLRRSHEVPINIYLLSLGLPRRIHNPEGIYYGGTIAAPVVKDIFENILPYMGIQKDKRLMSEDELKKEGN